jgi:hypothetical protein
MKAFLGRPFLALLRALSAGKNVGQVANSLRYALIELMMKMHDDSSSGDGSPLMLICAQRALEEIVVLGDEGWKIPPHSDVVVLDGLDMPDTVSIDGEMPVDVGIASREGLGSRDLTPRVVLIDVSPIVSHLLGQASLDELSAEEFEDFVADRLRAMNFSIQKVGGTYERDGGIDFLAVPNAAPIPYLLAVQVKHSRSGRSVGPSVVRELGGVLTAQPIDVGLIVTNTRFTPDAQWVAREMPKLMRLRDATDLQRWLQNEFGGEDVFDELPRFVRLAPGLDIPVPRPIGSSQPPPGPSGKDVNRK